MQKWIIRITLLSGAYVLPASACAQQLNSTDLTVAGIPYLADTAVARHALGAPLRADSTTWSYADLELTLEAGRVIRFWLRGPSRTTSRGLRVGDRKSRIALLYPHTCFESAELVQVCWRTDDFDSRGMVVQLKDGRIAGIIIGHAFDP